AGQRRRSTVEIVDVSGKKGEIVALAQTLAARRDSVMNEPDGAAAAAAAATAAAAGGAGGAAGGGGAVTATAAAAAAVAAVTADPAEQAAVARRRSSVLNRIPDNLRALVQQSDASGVQQKSAAPGTQGQNQGETKDEMSSKSKASTVSSASSNITGAPTTTTQSHTSWIQNVLAFIRWKGRGKKNRASRRNEGAGGNENGCTPFASPTPGSHRKSRALLPPQLPMFVGRKQLILDLDETLVHSSFKPVPGADYIMDIDVDNTFYKVFVLKRPGVDEFLERMARTYEVIVFTASLPQYANPLLDLV
ncbi:unnamed protein product, partial [Laminaria digitata]